MIRPLFSALSPSGARARLVIMIYHRVLHQPDPLFPEEVHSQRFDETCQWLASWFNVLPLDEAVARLQSGGLPERALAITFDDGYADNHDVAMPILQRHGLCATFFIATGFLDGGLMWNDSVIESIRQAPGESLDLRGIPEAELGVYPVASVQQRRQAIDAVIARVKYLEIHPRLAAVRAIADRCKARLPRDLMMTSQQVLAMHRGGMQIGAHTENHPILAKLSPESGRREMQRSKATLESIIGKPVTLFAYPNGKPRQDYGPEAVRAAKELGFIAAVTTASGVARQGADPFQLPRFTPWDRQRLRFGARMARALRSPAPELVQG